MTKNSRQATPKVLVIDDEPALRRVMKKALKNEGYELFFAENGREGLQVFLAESPVLVFLDLRMPVMDGFGFLEAITIKPDDPFMVIVITGHGADADIERCYRLGIDFFLKKPLSMVEITCLAKRCIEIKWLEIERQVLVDQLQHAISTIRRLEEFLLFCASCKRVRNEEGEWQNVDSYIRSHSDIEISHGICPDCVKKLYPEYSRILEKKNKGEK